MLSNDTNQPKSTVVPSGTLLSTSSDTHQVVKTWKETSAKMNTPF